jgi:glycerol kinase
MRYILALDQGTTSSRSILFDTEGRIVAQAQQELRQIYPQPGWVEQDAEEIWQTQYDTARQVLAGINPRDVAAIGLTNQRETSIVWDRRTGKPIHNAIVWQDRRTADACLQLRERGVEALFSGRTGLLLDPYFSGTKVRWILDHVAGARERADRGELAFGTVDSWLIWKLTGGRVHVTDASNASRTLLFNIHNLEWDAKLEGLLGVPGSMLPGVVASSGIVAASDAAVFGASLPIAGVAGDQQAALYGQQCTRRGMVKNTYGTGCFMLMNTGERPVESKNRLLSTVAWRKGVKTDYALEGSIFIAGAVVQWLRDGLHLIRSASEAEALAQTVTDNGGVYLVPAFAGLGAPHWDSYARGSMAGLTRGSTAGHIARAALESIAYQTADVLDAMVADSGVPVAELRVDGGASQNDLLMQFQADVMNVPVLRSKVQETTALGAAYLAGIGVGFWDGEEVLARHWQLDRRFEPAMSRAERSRLREEWDRALGRSKSWLPGAPQP